MPEAQIKLYSSESRTAAGADRQRLARRRACLSGAHLPAVHGLVDEWAMHSRDARIENAGKSQSCMDGQKYRL